MNSRLVNRFVHGTMLAVIFCSMVYPASAQLPQQLGQRRGGAASGMTIEFSTKETRITQIPGTDHMRLDAVVTVKNNSDHEWISVRELGASGSGVWGKSYIFLTGVNNVINATQAVDKNIPARDSRNVSFSADLGPSSVFVPSSNPPSPFYASISAFLFDYGALLARTSAIVGNGGQPARSF